ncbi:helix-turn-helix domain-containing protein [Shewanella loihica]|uniref:Transcriptional regulator n=1 Tax=Shewanella loihica (strain ATCC BAA-1088 / PV-4) TaxID=323850 RepID=A3QBK9_SHELP|nr:helix-turn-helix domain-containing protein [Shewanella loihica]ABO22857.1 hypothetical protein Shew_0986 [Shewanella loihica PV-4]
MATYDSNGSEINGTQARSFGRVLSLLVAVERLEKPNLDALVERTNLPGRSIHAMIGKLHKDYFVVIERQNGRRFGYYKVVDWGVLDRDRILKMVGDDESEKADEEQCELDFQPI